MTAPLRPWDRRADETVPAFEAFAHYRDSDPKTRSIERTSEALGKIPANLYKWSVRHEWVNRVKAHDTDIARRASERTEEDDVEALARQVRTMRAVQAQMGKRLLTNAESVSPADAGRLLIAAAKEEREARRLPAKVDVEHGGSVGVWFGFDDEVARVEARADGDDDGDDTPE